ncbi:hypothetical protein DPMN_134745 [Dreissena polymorpha]|uniref:Uncharacterized protein n=1 Tax=Dreissena polymorpha TaxID=45954 RepID=A0A9D4FW63_DREPO|nr:hypothetical protein DPMN_134745 [Dreissena polymorpha]
MVALRLRVTSTVGNFVLKFPAHCVISRRRDHCVGVNNLHVVSIGRGFASNDVIVRIKHQQVSAHLSPNCIDFSTSAVVQNSTTQQDLTPGRDDRISRGFNWIRCTGTLSLYKVLHLFVILYK